jgi:transcription elongation factor SPT6
MDSLIDDRAMIDDEEDESFDEETGEVRTKQNGTNARFDDSSEEDDEDDDEEAAAEVSWISPWQVKSPNLTDLLDCPRLHR